MRKQIYSALDIINLNTKTIATIKQFDSITLSLEIRENDKTIDLSNNTAILKIQTRDKKVYKQTDNIEINNNIVTIKVKSNVFAMAGLTEMELQIINSDGDISSASFAINVQESINMTNAEDNTDYIDITTQIQQALSSINNKIDNVKLQDNILTFYANNKEITNVTLPTIAGEKGKDGISLDYKWNGTSLGIKKSNETTYTYVNLKGDTGTDGKDGVNGKNGVDGKDGHTPIISIGYNGNWFINGVDTGKPSKGTDGTNGKNGLAGTNGLDGKNGLSAYQIACNNGFKGTESEWLQSLKGKDGKDSSSEGISTGKVNLSDVVLDEKGLQTLNGKIAYKHAHEGSQIICNTRKWANDKYILEDIIDFIQKEIEDLKAKIK